MVKMIGLVYPVSKLERSAAQKSDNRRDVLTKWFELLCSNSLHQHLGMQYENCTNKECKRIAFMANKAGAGEYAAASRAALAG